MNYSSSQFGDAINQAIEFLRAGGVVAYPTEYCFGLGCDPNNVDAVKRLLSIKQRQREQGVILIAASSEQACDYVELDRSPIKSEILASWPGPNTWILPARDSVSEWVRGRHQGVAIRVPEHSICLQMCSQFESAIVSTSANRHGQPALLNASDVQAEMGVELDYVLDAPVGGALSASTIRDGLSGAQIR